MDTRSIGALQVSVVGIGCNNFGGRIDDVRTAEVVQAALDAGINFFDTADVYGGTKSEEFLGRALGARRDEAVIASKFGSEIDPEHKGARPDYVKRACEDSLRRLGTDRIDLYQLHRADPETPIAETLGALNELVAEGKVLEIGCSNFDAAMLADAEGEVQPGAAGFVSVQNHYSLLERADAAEVLPFCEKAGVAYLPYFPLANGLLTGKYRRGAELPEGARITGMAEERRQRVANEKNMEIVEQLIAFAESKGHTVLDLAFASLLAEPEIASVIAGATSGEQVRANAATASWRLSEDDVAAIDAIAPRP
ncbi:MAG TPA: aldo/keto reductase [Acidimicrobiales bacterium]|nr:aldo/keto reductase [Acidimicrobiales bacterium]